MHQTDPTQAPLAILSSSSSDDNNYGWEENPNFTPIQAKLFYQVNMLTSLNTAADIQASQFVIHRFFSNGTLIGAMAVTTHPIVRQVCQPLDFDSEGRLSTEPQQVSLLDVPYIDCDWMHPLANNVGFTLSRILWPVHMNVGGDHIPELPFTLIRCPLVPSILQNFFLIGFQPAIEREDGVIEVAKFSTTDLMGLTTEHLLHSVLEHSYPSFGSRVMEYFSTQLKLPAQTPTTVLLFNADKTL
uniref:Uncharacterized protein n=1 Tax=Clandestinovirus TaxID=2831644 RepID=A0A8F8KPC4_9VIRU|nr:hypothetical protein KOM_12_332 [Clandestinovirus]